jgi:hypothetical protein
LPHLIDFYEDHQADRDQFEILAFHDATAKTFAELDPKLEPIVRNVWGGRSLPFPILMDSTGKTIEDFGVHAFPTMLLIDPEGKLVGQANEDVLEKKLPPIPMAKKVPRALDRNVGVFFRDPTLHEAAELIAQEAKVPVKLDADALRALNLTPETKVPLQLAGMISTRSALDLAFAPFGLAAEVAPEGLVVKRPSPGANGPAAPSKPQETCARRIREKLAAKASFRLGTLALEKLAAHFEGQTEENFVLDPAGRKSGAVDPKATIEAVAQDEPLGEALGRILRPLGLRLEVRDEVVVIASSPPPAAREGQ